MNVRTLAPILTAAALVSAIQAQPPAASSAPTIHVYSRETLVDVTVTDSKGNPVHSLKQADFTITEDGAPQSIRSFQAFSTPTTTAPHTLPKLPPNIYTNLQPGVGPLNVFLVDDVNGGDSAQARWAIASFIRKMAPGTRVALVALGFRFTVLQGPTTDPAPLLNVVNRLVEPLSVPPAPMYDPCAPPIIVGNATLDQLKQLATYLSGINGRKNVIWIGSGNTELTSNGCQSWRKPLQQIYDLLANAQITLYPLDPRGVRRLDGSQLAMEAVAEATGGIALYERNDLDTLMARAADSGASYYTLSYSPPSLAYDGRYHAIGVQVDKPGLHLVYRKGYTAEDPQQTARSLENSFGYTTRDKQSAPAADPLSAAMALIIPPATQLLFDVRVEPSTTPPSPSDPPGAILGALNPKFSKAPLTRYSFLFAVPASQIAFNAGDAGTYSGSLEFNLAAYDSEDHLVTSRSQTMKLPLTAAEYKQFIATPFQLLQEIDLPPGLITLRAGVLDGVSQKLGTLDIPMTVGHRTPLPLTIPKK
ncbi:MAG: VWA domain-containing protein [Acidobacteriaceae bacterium]|jgi:VWFA-related protein